MVLTKRLVPQDIKDTESTRQRCEARQTQQSALSHAWDALHAQPQQGVKALNRRAPKGGELAMPGDGTHAARHANRGIVEGRSHIQLPGIH